MTPDEIPQQYLDILNKAAGRQHSRTGTVAACLAEILTAYRNDLQDHDKANARSEPEKI